MPYVRYARRDDIENLKELWKLCFGDPDSFVDWFFKNRFFPDLCICMEENGKVVTAMYAYPIHVRLRQSIVPSAMLCGFSTHPDYRHRGYLRQCFHTLMRKLYKHARPAWR